MPFIRNISAAAVTKAYHRAEALTVTARRSVSKAHSTLHSTLQNGAKQIAIIIEAVPVRMTDGLFYHMPLRTVHRA